MILVTRLTGSAFAVNPDLLERVESTPDTVLTLIDGTKYLVSESVVEVIDLVRDYRASVVAGARALREPAAPPASVTALQPGPHAADAGRPELHVVPTLRAVPSATPTATPEEV